MHCTGPDWTFPQPDGSLSSHVSLGVHVVSLGLGKAQPCGMTGLKEGGPHVGTSPGPVREALAKCVGPSSDHLPSSVRDAPLPEREEPPTADWLDRSRGTLHASWSQLQFKVGGWALFPRKPCGAVPLRPNDRPRRPNNNIRNPQPCRPSADPASAQTLFSWHLAAALGPCPKSGLRGVITASKGPYVAGRGRSRIIDYERRYREHGVSDVPRLS